MMKRLISFVSFFVMGAFSFVNAQCPDILKAKDAMEEGYTKKAVKVMEGAVEDDQCRRMAETYYVYAQTLINISKDEMYADKYPDAVKDAMKAVSRGMRRDDKKEYLQYAEFITELVGLNNEMAKEQYGIGKYYKAKRVYEDSYELWHDTTAYFWVGKCLMEMRDTAAGMIYYDTLMQWYNAYFDVMETTASTWFKEPYLFYGNFYWNRGSYDTARIYLEQGRKVFGADERIDYFLLAIAKEEIRTQPPSWLMMQTIKDALVLFPTDTFLLKKQNALYIYLLKKELSRDNSKQLDIRLAQFAEEKVDRWSSEHRDQYKRSDIFLQEKPEDVLWKLAEYCFKHDHDQLGAYLAEKYIRQTAKGDTEKDIENRWAVIIDYASKSKSLNFTASLIKTARTIYTNKSSLQAIQKEITMKNIGKRDLDIYDQIALYRLMEELISDGKLNAQTDKTTINEFALYHSTELVKNRMFVKALGLGDRMKELYPLEPKWSAQEIYVAKEDFYHGYYQTRLKKKEVNGKMVSEFEWNGGKYTCKEGSVPEDIQLKVQGRINYFRRQAGVDEIVLDPQLNDWCQKAALMMAANDKLDHEPTKYWKCFSDEGAEAAKFSLLTEGANNSIAVTSFFADQNNTAVGNRRWMLFPHAQFFGHGSTDNYCAIWAVDDSGRTDSVIFEKQFVAWPPEGAVPSKMVFKNWSFSLYADFKGAKVTMKQGKEEVTLTQHEIVDGYGMPTLVWTPEVDPAALEAETVYDVKVALKSGRIFSYKVRIFPFDPVGY